MVQSHTDIDLEPWVPSVLFISLGTLLDGFLVLGEMVLELLDPFQEMLLLLFVSVFPGSDGDDQQLTNPPECHS